MAHKLYTDALSKVQQQRRALLVQLHAALRDSTSANGRRWASCTVCRVLDSFACCCLQVLRCDASWVFLHPIRKPGQPDQAAAAAAGPAAWVCGAAGLGQPIG